MELREEFQPKTTEEENFPKAKEVHDLQFIVKDGNLYIMVQGKWYLVNSLTEV